MISGAISSRSWTAIERDLPSIAKPNFEAILTSLRIGASACPMSSSLVQRGKHGGHADPDHDQAEATAVLRFYTSL